MIDPEPTGIPGAGTRPGISGNVELTPTGDGLAASQSGFTIIPASSTMTAAQPVVFTFHITGADGRTVTRFLPNRDSVMDLYLIRSDVTGFQHVYPAMTGDGTWTAPLAAADPGSYRAVA